MPKQAEEKNITVVIKFSGGLHTRAPADEVGDTEATEGQNFELDLLNTQYRPRRPFELLGTVPNASEIRGFASLLKTDGSVSFLVQAAETVYKWDGTAFTSVGTVDPTARLRGHIWHNWQLDNKVLITDINLADVVMEWDGTTLSDVAFTDEVGSPFGEFRAKYCIVQNERVIFANVVDSAPLAIPHMIVGTKVSDFTQITVNNLPSSALGEDDPYYLLVPDLRYINGLLYAFEIIVTSTKEGQVFKLTGGSAQDYQFNSLYPRSGASGDESMRYVGNDIYYGRQGRIESLASSDKFGNVETDDLSVQITDQIESYQDWTLTYNERTQRVFCHAKGTNEMFAFYKPLAKSGRSPWQRYVTENAMAFNPTTEMNAYDPIDGLEYIFMGDTLGNLYKMEGPRGTGDAQIDVVTTSRLSKMILIPSNAEMFSIFGWVRYRKIADITLRLDFEFQGDEVFTESIDLILTGSGTESYYGGGFYYGASDYYGSDTKKFQREKFGIPGKSTEVQVRASVQSISDFAISEIGLKFGFS